MCLTSADGPFKAAKDITCYKVLEKTSRGLESIVQNATWTLNRTKTVKDLGVDGSCVEEGLHSFKTREAARRERMYNNDSGCVVVKCIIPKGATYYKGLQGGENGYVSTKLRALEVAR